MLNRDAEFGEAVEGEGAVGEAVRVVWGKREGLGDVARGERPLGVDG